ncbi:MAG TPA: alpha/beta hydrolase [Gemmatimonadaceae bacterium]
MNAESEARRLSHRGRYPEGVEGVDARYITLRSGLHVRVVESGLRDSFPIILVPGWGCGAWIFHESMHPLAACGFRAIAVELKGHGFSDKPSASVEYSLESMRDHLLDIIDALELNRAGIVGHSMGAAIAAQAAAAAPGRIDAVVLAAPVGFAGVRGMGLFRFITPAFALRIFPYLASRLLIRGMLAVVYGSLRRPTTRDVEEFYAPVKTSGGTAGLRHLLHKFEWHSPFPELAMPFMTILGSEDVLSPESDRDRYEGGELLVIRDAGHVLFDEAPDEINAALCRFFGSNTSPYISMKHE